MQSRFYCSTCQLVFTTGWNHFHAYVGPYAAATALVCTACGHSYHVLHSHDPRTPDQLHAVTKPLRWPTYRTDTPDPHLIPNVQWVRVPTAAPLRPSPTAPRLDKLAGLQDALDLAPVQCTYCNAVGSLTADWPRDATTCPCCRKPTLRHLGSFMT